MQIVANGVQRSLYCTLNIDYLIQHFTLFVFLSLQVIHSLDVNHLVSVDRTVQSAARWTRNSSQQLLANDALLSLVAQRLLPLSLSGQEEFVQFCATLQPSYTPPCPRTLRNVLLPNRCKLLHQLVNNLIVAAVGVCVTLDIWSNRNMQSFIGVTAHMCVDYKLEAVLLACRKMTGRHTAVNVLASFKAIVSEYALDGKLVGIVTDNASNMCAAFNLEGQAVPVNNHDEQEDDVGDVEDLESDPEPYSQLPPHMRCFCHTLQLVVRDGLLASKALNNAIRKTSRLVSHVRKSISATELLEMYPKLQQDVCTRWNSEIKMLRSVLQIPRALLEQLDTPYKLTAHDVDILTEFVKIMEPFEVATDQHQSHKSPTSSLVIPTITGLHKHLAAIECIHNKMLVTALSRSMTKRLTQYETDSNYIRATILDPRFKLRWADRPRWTALTDDIRSITPVPENRPAVQAVPSLFSYLPEVAQENIDEATAYLDEPCTPFHDDPLQYWQGKDLERQFPELAKLSQKYMCMQSSSSAIERMFSSAGKITRPERSRLSKDVVEQLMYVKANNFLH